MKSEDQYDCGACGGEEIGPMCVVHVCMPNGKLAPKSSPRRSLPSVFPSRASWVGRLGELGP